MQKKCNQKLSSLILCIVLMVAMALFAGGCGDKKTSGESADSQVQAGQEADAESSESGEPEYEQLGEGSTEFIFTVTDKEGNETKFEIHTDQKTVGEALVELELIAGEESEYGLYVKTVNGISADYDTDGVYWAFYINDEYAQTGVDATEITPGDTYSFKVE